MQPERPLIHHAVHFFHVKKTHAIKSPKMCRYNVGYPKNSTELRYIEILLKLSLIRNDELEVIRNQKSLKGEN